MDKSASTTFSKPYGFPRYDISLERPPLRFRSTPAPTSPSALHTRGLTTPKPGCLSSATSAPEGTKMQTTRAAAPKDVYRRAALRIFSSTRWLPHRGPLSTSERISGIAPAVLCVPRPTPLAFNQTRQVRVLAAERSTPHQVSRSTDIECQPRPSAQPIALRNTHEERECISITSTKGDAIPVSSGRDLVLGSEIRWVDERHDSISIWVGSSRVYKHILCI